jgi:hypothetical protein
MAERRMFAKTIIDSDAFLEMPQSTQLLYFHLSMRADDDGFINKPRAIMRTVGAKDDDLAILGAKKFIIPFESGIVVIKHWKIHNYIQSDRKQATKYKDELSMLELDENNAYRLPMVNSAQKAIPHIEEECVVDGEIIDKDCVELRKEAYAASDLPYSFIYKIRLAFWNKPCPICGAIMKDDECTRNLVPSIQHNTPISKGGKHELGNISVICKRCNVSIRNNVTGSLNSEEVTRVWNEILVSKTDTQVRLGEVREGKDSIGEEREDDGIDASATPSPVTKNDVDKPKPDKKPKKQISPEEEAFRADLENKKLYHAINDPILEKAQTFCNYGREGEAVWQAVHKLKEKLKGLDLDPFDTVCNMVSTYLELTDSGKDFWVEVTPTKFASCFEKVWAESQKSSGFSLPDDRRIDPSLIR